MFDTVVGLPVHPLVVHAVVVLLPLAALLTVAVAFVPALRRFALPVVVLDAVMMVVTFAAKESGEALEERVTQFSAPAGLHDHEEWGERLFLLSVALFIGALVLYLVGKRSAGLARAVGALLVVACLGVLVVAGLAGHSGAEMVWKDVVANTTAGD